MLHWLIIAGEIIVATILIVLAVKNGRKIDNQLSTEGKLRAVNEKLQARVLRLELTDKQHSDDIDLLQKQMLQVHEWVSQVTFSDFIDKVDTLRDRVKETKEQRERRLDRNIQAQEYYEPPNHQK
jgi:hypothetical protein